MKRNIKYLIKAALLFGLIGALVIACAKSTDPETSSAGISISDVIYDSRKVCKDCVFVCLVGSNADGPGIRIADVSFYLGDTFIAGAECEVHTSNLARSIYKYEY